MGDAKEVPIFAEALVQDRLAWSEQRNCKAPSADICFFLTVYGTLTLSMKFLIGP
jgi:hypothetical protein